MTSYSPDIPDDEKWERLQAVCISDSKNQDLKALSDKVWDISLHRPTVFVKLALSVARDGIVYESDIKQFGHEDIAGVTREPQPDDALDAYKRGSDDCDAKARFFVALCLAQGFRARLWPLWKHNVLQHVAAEVHLDGRWIHAETILARAQLGEMHGEVPKEPNGHWRMS